jgi:hypothetical protein
MAKNNSLARLADAAFTPDQTAVEVSRAFSAATSLLSNVLEPADDLQGTINLHRNSLSVTGRVFFGRVQFSMPYFGWYRVALADGQGIWPCTLSLNDTSPNIIGPRSTAVLPPDTKVAVTFEPNSSVGNIIGVLPEIIMDGSQVFSDCVAQGNNVGVKKNGYYWQYITQLADDGGVLDFSSSRPMDGTIYDWGIMAETGVGVHVDPDMTFLRVSEDCGVFAFVFDHFLRVTGHNSEYISAAHRTEYRHDEGEHRITKNEALYPWEALGAFEFGAQVFRENSDVAVQYDKPEAKFEPLMADQQPFYRYREHGGYTGQGRIREMVLPPDGVSGSELNRYGSTQNYLGVFREQIGIDGLWAVESAKGVVLAKRSLVASPREVRPCDDYSQECDSKENDNYKFSGLFGGGKEHKVGDIENPAGDNAPLMSACGVLDAHTQYFNWRSVHPFAYHEKDYRLPEESELKLARNQTGPSFADLKDRTWLKRPEPKKQRVDHRMGDVDYWELYSHITLTEDGGVVIHGGHGEEIRMVGGNITISAPGNIFLQSGKSTVLLSGDDAVVRANNSVDISANKKDVRLKAHVNLHAVSGVSGEGGTLFENQAKTEYQVYPETGGEDIRSSGIVFKAANSQIAAMGKDIYLRTGNVDAGIAGGDIVLDAAKGDRNIIATCGEFRRFMRSRAYDAFGFPNVRSVNAFSQSETLLGSQIRVRGSMDVRGGIRAREGVTVASGHFMSQVGGEVGRLRNPELVREQIETMQQTQEDFRKTASGNYEGSFTEQLYRDEAIGNAETQKKISFSYRTEKQYGTDRDFVLPQTHYQILANANSGGTTVWKEEVVKYQGKETMPWPGLRNWRDDQTFLTLPAEEFKMYDLEEARAKPREHGVEIYENASYGNFQRQYPDEHYRVIDMGD